MWEQKKKKKKVLSDATEIRGENDENDETNLSNTTDRK